MSLSMTRMRMTRREMRIRKTKVRGHQNRAFLSRSLFPRVMAQALNSPAPPILMRLSSINLSVTQLSGDEEEEFISNEVPDFNDLGENLQRAFHKYLELRGITTMPKNFLHEYMINKDSREYLLWLRKLKGFFKQ